MEKQDFSTAFSDEKHPFAVDMPKRVMDLFKQKAKKKGLTRNNCLLMLIIKYLEEE